MILSPPKIADNSKFVWGGSTGSSRGRRLTALRGGLATTGVINRAPAVAASEHGDSTGWAGRRVIQVSPHLTRCKAQVPYPAPLGERIKRLQTIRGTPQYLLTNVTQAAT